MFATNFIWEQLNIAQLFLNNDFLNNYLHLFETSKEVKREIETDSWFSIKTFQNA